MAVTTTEKFAALFEPGASATERAVLSGIIKSPSEVVADGENWADQVQTKAKGHLTWLDFAQGNSVLVSRGTNAAPDDPVGVQLTPGQMLGRLATGDAVAVSVGDMLALSNSTIEDFYDVAAATSSSTRNVLTEQGDGTYQFQKLPDIAVQSTAPSTTDGSVLWLNNASNALADLYFYDTARSKWLSTRTCCFDFYHNTGTSIATSAYYSMPVFGTTSTTVGYGVGFDLTFVGLELNVMTVDSGGGAGIFAPFRSGSALGGGGISVAQNATGSVSKTGVNLDFDAGGVLSATQATQVGAGSVHATLIARRRTS